MVQKKYKMKCILVGLNLISLEIAAYVHGQHMHNSLIENLLNIFTSEEVTEMDDGKIENYVWQMEKIRTGNSLLEEECSTLPKGTRSLQQAAQAHDGA